MKALHFLNVLPGIILLFAACNDKDLKATTPCPTLPPTNIVAYSKSKPELLTINATSGGSVYSSCGARFVFPPHAFYTMDGSAVTGPLTIEVSESIMEQNMTLGSTLNLHTGEILVPGAFFTVKAKQGRKLLKINPYVRYQANW